MIIIYAVVGLVLVIFGYMVGHRDGYATGSKEWLSVCELQDIKIAKLRNRLYAEGKDVQ